MRRQRDRMPMHAASLACLLLVHAGCAHRPGAADLDCAPRTLPTVRLTRLHEVVIHRNLDLSKSTNRGRFDALRTLFESFACTGPSLAEKPTGIFRQPNLSCALRGEVEDLIVVGARFDKSSGGVEQDDNWSGASLLPALRLSLSDHPRHHSFEFVAFASRDRALGGATSFVDSLDAEQIRRIRAMVNLDGLGTGPLGAELSHSDPELLCDFWATAELLGMPLRATIAVDRARGDTEPFRRIGIPVIDLSSLTGRDPSSGTTHRSSMEAIDEKAYHDAYRLITVYLAMLDERLLTRRIDTGDPGAPPGLAR
jgi:hypothetical protein